MPFGEILNEQEQELILGQKPTQKLYFSFSDFNYNDKPKQRALSGIKELDYLLKGFEMCGVTIWTGVTNAR